MVFFLTTFLDVPPPVSGVSFRFGRFGVGYGAGFRPRTASQSKGNGADSEGLVTGEGG